MSVKEQPRMNGGEQGWRDTQGGVPKIPGTGASKSPWSLGFAIVPECGCLSTNKEAL